MPDLQRIIEIVFQGTDEVSDSVTSVTKGLDAVSDKARDVTQPLAAATDFIIKLDTALLALGATLVGVAVNEAGKFHEATNEILTLVDGSPEQFDALKESISDYARDSTQSLETITSAVYAAISAGVEYTDAVQFVSDAERLAVAGRAELNDTTVLLASTLNAYGAETEEAARYSDILFKTVKLGQTTIPELASSLAQVTSIASSAGVPFEDLAAAVAALTAKGIPTSEAITALKATLSNLIKPSNAATDAAEELGIEFSVQALQAKGLEGFLVELGQATGNDSVEMGRLFGSTEALNGALALTADGASKFSEKLREIENVTGAVTEAYGKMAGNFSLINQNLQNNLRLTFVDVGEKLLDQYSDTATALGGVFKAIGEEVDRGGFNPILDVVNAFGANAENALEQIAGNMRAAFETDNIDFDALKQALFELGEAIGLIFEGVDISTPEGLAKAIQQVVKVGESLVQTTTGIVTGLKPFLQQAAALVVKLSEAGPEAEKFAGEMAGIGKGINTLLGFMPNIIGGIDALAISLGAIAGTSALKTITGMAGGLRDIKVAAGSANSALGKAGFVGAIGYLAYELGRWADLNDRLVPGVDTLGTKIYDWLRPQKELNAELDITTGTVYKTTDAVDKAGGVYENSGEKVKVTTQAHVEHGEALALTAEEIENAVTLEKELDAAIAQETENIAQADAALGKHVETLKDQVQYTSETVDGVTTYTQVLGIKTQAQGKDIESTKAAGEETEKFRLELEKIASDERLANIEARVSLEIADVQANAEIAVAAFESLNVGIQSTGELLGELYGLFADAEGFRDKWFLQDEIERERELREGEFELQRRLVDQQIRYLDEKTRSLARGDALIKIQGDGLEPELEAFMWKIVERVQIRASDEGAEFLLGIA